jgi:ubiquitin-protein ligase
MDWLRAERLIGDYEEMGRIRGEVITWTADGQPPDLYTVTYHLWSLTGPATRRYGHQVRFRLGEMYPTVAPSVTALGWPPIFHPNVFEHGRICIGAAWHAEEGLGSLVIRVARMLA